MAEKNVCECCGRIINGWYDYNKLCFYGGYRCENCEDYEEDCWSSSEEDPYANIICEDCELKSKSGDSNIRRYPYNGHICHEKAIAVQYK